MRSFVREDVIEHLSIPLCLRPLISHKAGALQGSRACYQHHPVGQTGLCQTDNVKYECCYYFDLIRKNRGIHKSVLQCFLLKIHLKGLGRSLSVLSSTGYYITLNYLFSVSGKKKYRWRLLRTTGWEQGVCVKGEFDFLQKKLLERGRNGLMPFKLIYIPTSFQKDFRPNSW